METKFIILQQHELKSVLLEVLTEVETKKQKSVIEQKQKETLYTINQVALKLKRGHKTIKKLIADGVLKATADGRITEKSLLDYLNN